ncbi:redoxin domain-containing protein [Alkalibacillus salilacus]|uniref:Thiol-disulfide isomerase/thioredoxin n=1 Tax=Alkalibacillus salilacus TaxID=284582 RepID=A0ABT9VG85_9BACI|nr:redoxin domain-containing protein [Alkalibacillus salilacus]MDQ0159956.1 thiol-disulfide isomerase/thioredoxin [Alkalibacillus salilacus]
MKKVLQIIISIALISALAIVIIDHFEVFDSTSPAEITEGHTNSEFDAVSAPNFKLNRLNDGELELTELQGKGVVVNFWASWCQPCRHEMPVIQKVYDYYEEDGLEVIAINVDESEDTITNFLGEIPEIDFPILLNDGQVMEDYMVMGLPTTYFINPDGSMEDHYVGELHEEQLHVLVNEILPSD